MSAQPEALRLASQMEAERGVAVFGVRHGTASAAITELRRLHSLNAWMHGALLKAQAALESLTPGDYSTGHVVHPSFDERLCAIAEGAIASAIALAAPEASQG